MKKIATLLAILLALTNTFAQRGKDGNKTVTAAATVVNTYTTLSADAAAGQSSITVASNTLTGSGFTGNLAKGDLVMIVQMQGATIDYAPDDNTYGAVTNYNNSGNNELAEVLSVSGSQQITFICPLKNSYTALGRTQVVRVPRYNMLTINTSTDITCPAWNGSVGGVVAVEVLGIVTINGKITATAKGFRGGLANENASTNGVTGSRSTLATYGGEKGEGIAGYVAEYDTMNGRYSFGAPANAGGGGNGHNAGGGGGANAGDINQWTGKGNPDITTGNYAPAWDLEGNSFSNATSSGGGKGGYTFSANDRNALSEPLYTSAWGGDWRNNVGGHGGRPLDYSTGRLFLGGGGGSGDQNDNTGGDGGIGGGMVYLIGFGDVSGSGTIESNGADGQNSGQGFTQGQDGAGGGGGGGTIVVKTTGTVTGIGINANGGAGGDLLKIIGNDCYGPGGGGGGRYIATSTTAVTTQVNRGGNGTTTLVTMNEFPPNGATMGASGVYVNQQPTFDITATGGTACTGQQLSLGATVTGTGPQGYSVEWMDENGASVGTGTSIQYTFTQPQTLYVHTCPGWFTTPVQLTAGTAPTALFTYTDQGGFNAQFQNTSTNGISYNWNFGDNSAASTDPNPLHHYNSEGTFTVTLITTNDCGSDTIIQSVTVIKVGLNTTATEAVTIIGSGEAGIYYIEPGTANCKQLDVLITDIAGRTLQQNRLFNAGNNRVGPINLGQYTQGMYILSFSCEGKIYYAKMIVR